MAIDRDIKVELINKDKVLGAIFDKKLPPELVDVNLMMVKLYAKFHRLISMPGFKITEVAIVSGRAQ